MRPGDPPPCREGGFALLWCHTAQQIANALGRSLSFDEMQAMERCPKCGHWRARRVKAEANRCPICDFGELDVARPGELARWKCGHWIAVRKGGG